MNTKLEINLYIQARTGSTRLPGKILKNIIDKPLLLQVIDRFLIRKNPISRIIILTSHSSVKDVSKILASYTKNGIIEIMAGEEEDVLSRYYLGYKKYGGDIIIRATADNPIVSISYLNKAVEHHIETKADLTHYLSIPLGSGVEIISPAALENSFHSTDDKYDREHVTPYIYKNRDTIFKVQEPVAKGIMNCPDMSITVDTIDDFNFVECIFKKFYTGKNDFPLKDVIKWWHDRQANK